MSFVGVFRRDLASRCETSSATLFSCARRGARAGGISFERARLEVVEGVHLLRLSRAAWAGPRGIALAERGDMGTRGKVGLMP